MGHHEVESVLDHVVNGVAAHKALLLLLKTLPTDRVPKEPVYVEGEVDMGFCVLLSLDFCCDMLSLA